MKYEREELIPFLHNLCGTFTLDGDMGYSRFTAGQLDYYGRRSDLDFVRSHTSAGVFLECVTDAEEISFVYRIHTEKGAWMDRSGIDIWENGIFSENIPLVITDSEWISVRYARREKEPSRVRICFPNGVIFLPKDFELGNAQPTPKKDRLILFYGDSLTQSAYIRTPSLSWYGYVAEYLGAEYINRGIGSMIFEAGSLPDETDLEPDMIFIEYGGNDAAKTPDNDSAERNAIEWIDKLEELYPNAEKYCILTDFRCPGDGSENDVRLHDLCARHAGICTLRGIPYIHGRELIPAIEGLFIEDRVHFNEAGSAIVANNLIIKLNQIRKNSL